jgi:hypothetical protein
VGELGTNDISSTSHGIGSCIYGHLGNKFETRINSCKQFVSPLRCGVDYTHDDKMIVEAAEYISPAFPL